MKYAIYFLLIIMTLLKYLFIFSFPISPKPADSIPEECMKNCHIPYGSVVGKFNGIEAFSNCSSDCINADDKGVYFTKSETGFPEDVYSGMRWQCVEYARRYLINVNQVSFESIDSAYQIFDIKILKILTKDNSFTDFLSLENGNYYAPEKGDLLIFHPTGSDPHGHVAVISSVNFEDGYVEIAEQNMNKLWENFDKFSRRIVMNKKDGKYFVEDIEWKVNDNKNNEKNKISSIIGWKRVGKLDSMEDS
jgi:CHAP domain